MKKEKLILETSKLEEVNKYLHKGYKILRTYRCEPTGFKGLLGWEMYVLVKEATPSEPTEELKTVRLTLLYLRDLRITWEKEIKQGVMLKEVLYPLDDLIGLYEAKLQTE